MRQRDVVAAICTLLLIISGLSAALLPVTGDSSAVWTAIDLSPTDSTMQMVSLISEETSASDSDSGDEATEYEQSPWDPVSVEKQSRTPVKKASQPVSAAASAPAPEAAASPSTSSTETASVTSTKVAATTSSDATDESAATADDSAAAATESTAEIIPGSIIITSIPENAQITINDVGVGNTPYNVQGFYPGFYDVTVTADGFAPFKKSIELKPGGTEFITAQLKREAGSLFVLSTPENATVSINDTVVGMTPFTSQPMQPGIYRLAIELTGYTPYTEQLGISPNLTDTLQIALLPEKKPGLFANVDFSNTQSIRRITFGAIGVVATATGLFLNAKTSDNIKREQSALDQYHEAKLSETEYSERYNKYRDLTKTTDRYALFRNLCYGLGIAGGVGFTVSIFY